MRMESSNPPDKVELDLTSKPRTIVLVQLARSRDLIGITFLIELHLCYYAAKMTSSWTDNKNFSLTKDLYRRLSASGEYYIMDAKWYVTYMRTIEGQVVSAGWSSLIHSYLSAPPQNPEWLADQLAGVINETRSFQSSEQSNKFVKTGALERIEEMIKTAHRLEKVFMVDVISIDMSLIFHYPEAEDGQRIRSGQCCQAWEEGEDREDDGAGSSKKRLQRTAMVLPSRTFALRDIWLCEWYELPPNSLSASRKENV